jgi:hypothetical protein
MHACSPAQAVFHQEHPDGAVRLRQRLKGNQNEIDLVAVNDLKKNLTVAEIKMNKARINLDVLKKKAGKLLDSYEGYEVTLLALALDDAVDYL